MASGGNRSPVPCSRRAVQDDGRRRPGRLNIASRKDAKSVMSKSWTSSSEARSMSLPRWGAALYAAKQATLDHPIVFADGGRPSRHGLDRQSRRDRARNVTGLSMQQTDAGSQAPRTVARDHSQIFAGWRSWPMSSAPGAVLECTRGAGCGAHAWSRCRDAAKSGGRRKSRPPSEAVKDRAEALYVVGDPLLTTNRLRISTLALAARLPTMSRSSGIRRSRRSDVLWNEHPRHVPARWRAMSTRYCAGRSLPTCRSSSRPSSIWSSI